LKATPVKTQTSKRLKALFKHSKPMETLEAITLCIPALTELLTQAPQRTTPCR
jgi:hypothetical protein